jgi:hypothetical protein
MNNINKEKKKISFSKNDKFNNEKICDYFINNLEETSKEINNIFKENEINNNKSLDNNNINNKEQIENLFKIAFPTKNNNLKNLNKYIKKISKSHIKNYENLINDLNYDFIKITDENNNNNKFFNFEEEEEENNNNSLNKTNNEFNNENITSYNKINNKYHYKNNMINFYTNSSNYDTENTNTSIKINNIRNENYNKKKSYLKDIYINKDPIKLKEFNIHSKKNFNLINREFKTSFFYGMNDNNNNIDYAFSNRINYIKNNYNKLKLKKNFYLKNKEMLQCSKDDFSINSNNKNIEKNKCECLII